MQIIIRQQRLAFRGKFAISINNQPAYSVYEQRLRWTPKTLIKTEGGEEILMTLTQKFNWFWPRYIINRQEDFFVFHTHDLQRSKYRCVVGQDLYEIIAHKGFKHSLIKNLIQIGWWDIQVVKWPEKDYYIIEVDDDVDELLVIALCVVVDEINNDKLHSVSLDVGNFPWGMPPFDENWRPKESGR